MKLNGGKMEYFDLTTPQKNIWNLQAYYSDTAIANLCGATFYHEKRNSMFMQQAIRQFIRNQSGIRLRFCEGEDSRQFVSNEIDEDIPIMTFSSMVEFDRYAKKFAREPLELKGHFMYRFVVFHVENRSGTLALLSHLISDAWTFGVMARQIDKIYHDLVADTENAKEIFPLKEDYIDYIHSEVDYMVSERYRKDRNYWEAKYIDCPQESLIKICSTSSSSIATERITEKLPLSLEHKMNAFCKTNSLTPAVLFETALIIYLHKIHPENSSITIGVPILNRSNVREKEIAGMFISTMPLTVTLTEDMTGLRLAKQITIEHINIFRHQKYPYADILKFIREKHKISGNLYGVMLSYQNVKTDIQADTKWYSNGYSEVPFVLHIDNRDGNNSHTINVDYQTKVFQKEEARYIINRLEFVLEQIIKNGGKRIKNVDIVPEQERKKIVCEFNDTYVAYPKDKCIHELFAEQAEKTPDKTALVFEDRKFTYSQLDEMSNSLAHFLRKKGVKPNDVVPVIAKRSWHVIVAMLGILKAGGAYMPVSPDYPEDRISNMIQIAESRIALLYGYEKQINIESIRLNDFNFTYRKSAIENINKPGDLAYIIFTSGSTGTPKGIEICHCNVCNYVHNNNNNVCNKIIRDQCESIVSVTNFIFDIFVTESILPLVNGLCIYLANEAETASQNRLSRLFEKSCIDVLQTTPTKMKSYILDKKNTDYLRGLKAIILGGEAFPRELYSELKKYTDAKIYNIYGPAETTVWSSNAEAVNDDITIGRPIANTQIYILDTDGNSLPIGVAGELCIAGEGVGKGYLNRPELTAERFVPNPFATKENHHGRILYHTGDLARWRSDGEIEYLGRIDTQVKIRGLRIELGEIESIMGTMEGIELAAVTDKRDEDGRQYLVGYYTAKEEMDEKKLREHLAEKLPRYMIPNFFMRLDDMPMTPSGKTDRKNLPMPMFIGQTVEYVAPVTAKERALCHLLEELLHMDRVGTQDDFFENGGDSFTAIEYTAKAHSEGIDFALQNVFDYPTVQALCDFLEKGESSKVHYMASDFDKYQKLLERNTIEESFVPEKKVLGNVLLTGATGFLGAHVLDYLMRKEEGKIYCLVRSEKKERSCEKVRRILQHYFGSQYNAEPGRRIILIEGDIVKDNLSENMPEDVQTVIHTAASVSHYGSYEYFHRVNVEGTRHVVNYAKLIGAKLIHVSTLSVSGNSMADDFTAYRSEKEKFFYETSLYIDQPLDNVYIRSKFEAETVVYDAMLEGLDAKVIRVGNLTNRATDYKFQPNYMQNAFLTRMKAFLEFGLFPDYLMPLYSEFSPVDLTAEGIVKIAWYADEQSVFHLNSNRPIYFTRFFEVVQELGISMKVVDCEEFGSALEQTMQHNGTEYIFEALQNDMDERGQLIYDSNIHIVNDFTVWFLKKVGFEWNETDREYIKGYIEYFRKLGYLKV